MTHQEWITRLYPMLGLDPDAFADRAEAIYQGGAASQNLARYQAIKMMQRERAARMAQEGPKNARDAIFTEKTSEGSAPSSSAPENGYTAASIRILQPEEIVERFEWAAIGSLAAQYRRPAAWIERGFAACQAAGVSPDYFVARYLEGQDLPRNDAVEYHFRQLIWGRDA